MADLKTQTPDTTLPATGYLIGADAQSDTDPAIYTVDAVAARMAQTTAITDAIAAQVPDLSNYPTETEMNTAISAALVGLPTFADMGEVVPASPYTQATVQAAIDTAVANCLAGSGPRRVAFYENFTGSGGVRAGHSVTNAPANMRIKGLELYFAPGVTTKKASADFDTANWNTLFEFIYCEGLTIRGGEHIGRVNDTYYEDVIIPFGGSAPNGATVGGNPLTGFLFGDDGFRFFSCDDLLLTDMQLRNYGDSAWRITPLTNDVEEAAGIYGSQRVRILNCRVFNSLQTSTTNTSGTTMACPIDYWMVNVHSERINSNKWAHRGSGKKSRGLYLLSCTSVSALTGYEIDGYSQVFMQGCNIRTPRSFGVSFVSNDTVSGVSSLGPDVLKITDCHIEASPTMATGYRIDPDIQGSGNACPSVTLQNCTFEGGTGWTGTAVGATTDATGYAIGATTITLASAGTGAINVGNYIKFGSSSYAYLVTAGDADVSNGGTVTIAAPGLRVAIPTSATAIAFPNTVAASFNGKFSDLHADIHLKSFTGLIGIQALMRETQGAYLKVSGDYPRNDGVGHLVTVERKAASGVYTSATQLEDVTIDLGRCKTGTINRFMLVDGVSRLKLTGSAYGSAAAIIFTNTTFGCDDLLVQGADFRTTGGAGLILNTIRRGFITDSILGCASTTPITINSTCAGIEITDSVKNVNLTGGNVAWATGGDGRGVTNSQGFVMASASRSGVNVDVTLTHGAGGTDFTVPTNARRAFEFIRNSDGVKFAISSVSRQSATVCRFVLASDPGSAGTLVCYDRQIFNFLNGAAFSNTADRLTDNSTALALLKAGTVAVSVAGLLGQPIGMLLALTYAS